MAMQKLISAHTHTHTHTELAIGDVNYLLFSISLETLSVFVCTYLCVDVWAACVHCIMLCVCVCVCVSVIMQVWEVMFWYPHTHQSSSWCSSVKTHTQPCGFTPPPSLVSGSRGLSAPLAEGSPYSQLQRVQKQQGWITQGTRQRLWWSKQSC